MNTKSSIIVLIVVVLIGGIIYVYGRSGVDTATNQTTTIENSKARLLKRVSSVDQTPLTEEEKITIFQSLSAEKSARYGFTPDEKAKVIEALNK